MAFTCWNCEINRIPLRLAIYEILRDDQSQFFGKIISFHHWRCQNSPPHRRATLALVSQTKRTCPSDDIKFDSTLSRTRPKIPISIHLVEAQSLKSSPCKKPFSASPGAYLAFNRTLRYFIQNLNLLANPKLSLSSPQLATNHFIGLSKSDQLPCKARSDSGSSLATRQVRGSFPAYGLASLTSAIRTSSCARYHGFSLRNQRVIESDRTNLLSRKYLLSWLPLSHFDLIFIESLVLRIGKVELWRYKENSHGSSSNPEPELSDQLTTSHRKTHSFF